MHESGIDYKGTFNKGMTSKQKRIINPEIISPITKADDLIEDGINERERSEKIQKEKIKPGSVVVLNNGTKVKVISVENNKIGIELSDGRVGWIDPLKIS